MLVCTRCKEEGRLGTPEQCVSVAQVRAHYGVVGVKPQYNTPFVAPKKLGRRGSVAPSGE